VSHGIYTPINPPAIAPTGSPGASDSLSDDARVRLLQHLPETKLADELNSPRGSVRDDLAIVASIFAAYRSVYPGKGNPVGDNIEITETLLGRRSNVNRIPFLRKNHAAINAAGELCDRWGTPLHFHAESGTRMEIRSAGPDAVMRTQDDQLIVP